jgi:hypothetical protein
MQFTKPIPFQEAIDKLGGKSLIGSALSSSEWADVPVQLRERAFFSARVESARVLQRGRDGIADFLQSNRETLPNGETALKVGSRQAFVDQMQNFLAAEGVDRTSGGLTDITSERRLGLIFDTQTQAAQDYGYRKQGMDPDVLNEFPAQRFIRVIDVKEPRNYHTEFEGHVYLKTDPIWTRINADFGVPWGPWGWGCGHDVEDVDRDVVEQIGLLGPNDVVTPPKENFNDEAGASIVNLDPELVQKLREEFGDQVVIEGDRMRWSNQLPSAKPPSVTVPKLDQLADEWKTADLATKSRLAEQAREAIEIPKEARKAVNLTMLTKTAAVKEKARAGAEIISRYVSANLIARTKIEVHALRGNRAFHRDGGIHINSGTSASTAAHEIMHGIEIQNPEVLKASAEFLYSRAAKGEVPQTLRKLTGLHYDLREIAIEDDWAKRGGDVYSGKVYSRFGVSTGPQSIRATEVLTMGIERLHRDPLEFYTNDRQYFDFVINILRSL